MKISFKGKIVAGALSVGLISGVGMAFANTDAGQALKSWYEVQFNNTVKSAKEDSSKYVEGKIPELYKEYEGIKEGATADINKSRDKEINRASTEITNAKLTHLESLGKEEKKISDGMKNAFDKVYKDGVKEIESAGKGAIDYANADLKSYTDQSGKDAIDVINQKLADAKKDAVDELQKAIDTSKSKLTNRLNSEKGETVEKWNKDIDKEIKNVRGEIVKIVDKLVKEQIKAIEKEALAMENEAKKALDEVVSGINK